MGFKAATYKVQGKNEILGVGVFPDRKRVCLYHGGEGWIEPLAYFTTEEKAQKFMDWLNRNFLHKRD